MDGRSRRLDGGAEFCISVCMRKMNLLLSCLLLAPVGAGAEDLTESTSLEITRSWAQEPGGWTYQMLLSVPDSMPAGGYPVCIVLHGANVPPRTPGKTLRNCEQESTKTIWPLTVY